VTGFADAESTFVVSVIKNKKCSTGESKQVFGVVPTYSIGAEIKP
jgi:hypothetical protein